MVWSSRNVSQLLLPTVFFGYALWVTGSFLVDANQYQRDLPAAPGSMINGQFTAKLETIYKDRLPYRLISVDLVGAARYLIFGEGRKGVVVGKEGWLFSSEEYRVASHEAQNLTDAADLIAKVRDQLAAQGSDLIVLPLPAKADVYREFTADPSLGDAMASRYAAFRDALTARSIKNVDTKTALLDTKGADQVFLKSDTHWTPHGAAVVADATARAAGPASNPVSFDIKAAETLPLEGDLTKFIVSAKYASYVSLPTEKVTVLQASAQAPADSGAVDLFGGPSINMALVGTSYSANERWGFLASLKADMKSDIVNYAEEGHGPLVPMWNYLKSDLATKTPPKLVIWEFPVRYLTDPDVIADIAARRQ
ncbi:alginate O-acetyltransferase complex protein AlgJ [Devosia sp. UYZn731]|uniref:alginate O-acetyltransferase AlgX-related protein n=1 Tax=Devosia sp. UYZn731 TaxID=3156345 RepID=UPI0033969BF3